MKKLLSLFALVLISSAAIAQDNDSSLIRKNGVIEVQKKLLVHAFQNNDSCLMNHRKYNAAGALLYEKTDMSCFGWPNTEEMFLTYKGDNPNIIEVKRDGKPFSIANYVWSQDLIGKPIQVSTHFLQTNDSSLVRNEYFKNDSGWLDSTYIVTKNQDGSVSETATVARYNLKGELVQLFNIGEDGIVLEMASYEMNDDGAVLSSAYTTYGEKPNFTQVFFEHNQKGQMVKSYNTANQKQEFFYLENGLIQNIYSYNPNGDLEMEYIFEYTYQ
ncbi:MAG: hypothetical protein KJP21_05800 [Bacteroidia bacterium]|nr:hypothetical protein [Bacteroidia bacterium]NNJ56135.1 hypothetical protein [Bacteroidia bacterium]